MSNLNIRIPNSLSDRLQLLSDQTGRTKSYYVRAALEEKLEELEDYYFALQSLENMASDKSRIWAHKEIKENRDLED